MNWQERALCQKNPELWFTESTRTAAVHICRFHCPVLKECQAWAVTAVVISGVAGGVAYGHTGAPMRYWANGDDVKLCRGWCWTYRKEE